MDPFARPIVRSRLESPPSDVADPCEALVRVETLQRELATLRETITGPTSRLSMGERAAASHHVAVIAGSLGVLHKALRLMTSGA